MGGQPIELLKQSMSFIISNLESNDRFGCIGYESMVHEIFKISHMNSENKDIAIHKINKEIKPLGMTALCHGLLKGMDTIRDIPDTEFGLCVCIFM